MYNKYQCGTQLYCILFAQSITWTLTQLHLFWLPGETQKSRHVHIEFTLHIVLQGNRGQKQDPGRPLLCYHWDNR